MATDPTSSTLATALQRQNVDALTGLYELVASNPRRARPRRKPDLVSALHQTLQDDAALRGIWARLDRLSQAAVASTVRSPTDAFQPDRFVARYGALPSFSTDGPRKWSPQPTRLALFFYDGVLPSDLKARLARIDAGGIAVGE